METKDRATRVAVLTALRDEIDAVIENERAELTFNLKELSVTFGVKAIDIDLPNGDKIASASLTAPEPKASVINEKAFTDWVTLNYPSEIIPSVRASFKKALLEKAEQINAEGEACNPRTGEIIEGVFFALGANPRLTLRFKKEGRLLVADAFNRGELEGIIRPLGLLELPAEVKGVEYLSSENLGDSPANDQTAQPEPSGALGG